LYEVEILKNIIKILSVTFFFSAHLGGFSSQAFAQDVFEGLKGSIERGEFSEQDIRNVLIIPYKDQWHEYDSEVGRGVLQFAKWSNVWNFILSCKRYDYDIRACLTDPEQGRGDFNTNFFDRAITQALQQYDKIADLSPSDQFAVFAYENLPKSLGDGSGMIYPFIEHLHWSLLLGVQCTKYYPSENSNLVINHFNKYELFHDLFGTFRTSNSGKLRDPNLETSLLKLNAPDGLSEESIKKAKETACPEHVDSIIKPLTDLEKQIEKNSLIHPSEQRIDGFFFRQFMSNLAENGPSTVAKFSNDLQNAYSIVAENEKFEKDRRQDVPSILAMCTQNPERCANSKTNSDLFETSFVRVLSLEEFRAAFHNKVYSIEDGFGTGKWIEFSLDFDANKTTFLKSNADVGEIKFQIIDSLKFCIAEGCLENESTFAIVTKKSEQDNRFTPTLGKFFNAVGYYQSAYVDYQGKTHPPIDTFAYCGSPTTTITQSGEEVLHEMRQFNSSLGNCRQNMFTYTKKTNENNSYFEGKDVKKYVFETKRAFSVDSLKTAYAIDLVAEKMCGDTPRKIEKLVTEYSAFITDPLFNKTQWDEIKDEAWEKAQIEMQNPTSLDLFNEVIKDDLIEKKGQKFVCNTFMESEQIQLFELSLRLMRSKENQNNDQGMIKKRKY